MRRAALYVHGRVVVADSHLGAYETLTIEERREYIISGFLDEVTGEFDADLAKDHFYNKEMYMIRHGETTNPNEHDPPISQQGQEQAMNMALQLKQEKNLSKFQCFTSPLLRCLQTADIFSKICNLEFIVDPALIEIPSFLAKDELFLLLSRKCDFPNFKWTFEDNLVAHETESAFIDRIKKVLQRLPHKSILVSHCGFISNMAALALCNEKMMECCVPTASLTHIDNQEVKCLGLTHNP